METDYLRSFLLVVESGSMSEAARRLGLTPAAVAQQMRTLERHLHASLLARAGRTVQPTAAGHKLVGHARALLREWGDIQTLLGQDETGGELVMGTINTALHSLFPDILARFIRTHPGVRVVLRSDTTAALYQALQQGAIDAAVCLHPPFTLAKTFGWALLRQEPLVLLAPQRLAGRDPHELLRTVPLIRYDRSLGGGKQAERYLRAAGIAVQERFELGSLLAIALMVSQGLGVALVPDTDSPLLAGQRLTRIALPLDAPARQFGVLWLRTAPRLSLVRGLVQSATAVVAARGRAHRAAQSEQKGIE